MTNKRTTLTLLALVFLAGNATAADLNTALLTAAASLAALMIAVQGLRWVISESPKGRAEAKKGILWTIMGLLVAYLAIYIVCGLYCYALESSYGMSITCGPPCR